MRLRMRILWIVNTIFPYPSEKMGYKKNVFGGWLLGLYNGIKKNKDICFAIATTYNGKELLKFNDDKTMYYLLPCKNNIKYDKNLEDYWKKIVTDFKPDLVHIHGTEYAHGLAFQNACPNIKTVVSIQGLMSVHTNNYIANITYKDILKNITLRDIIKRDNIFQQQYSFEKRGQIEKQIIKNSTAIIGRTEWDYANTLVIAGVDKYYKCNETLRDSFYNKNWDIKKIEKHSIFISQAGYPIKGFHMVLHAINILKKNYPDINVYIAGPNIVDMSTLKSKLKISGYTKYIISLIKKYELEPNIHFTGILSEEQMADKLLKSHVFIQASSIENSPNSLGEAMILGMPCVASNVGGTNTMLKDKEEGFLYPFGDYGLMAYYISEVFENDKLAINIGQKAKQHACNTHNKEKNVLNMLKIYEEIIKKGRK